VTVTTGPFVVQGGGSFNVPVPQGGIYAAVVFQNVSGANLLVSGGASVEEWLAQYQANVFLVDDTNANFALSAPAQAATIVGQLLATWYDPGELAAGIPGTFPAPLFGSAISAAISGIVTVSNPIDALGADGGFINGTFADGGNSAVFTALHAYQTLQVGVTMGAGGSATLPAPVAVRALNVTKDQFSQWQTIVLRTVNTPTGALFFPVPCDAGDEIEFFWALMEAATVDINLSLAFFGLGAWEQPAPLRADGRLKPIGTFLGTQTQVGAGGVNIFNAPGAGAGQLLLKSVSLVGTGGGVGGDFAALNVTIGGVTDPLVVTATGGFTVAGQEWEDGLLLDIGSAVQLAVAGGGDAVASAVCDVVG
jgi:hypothetical protein